MCTLSWKPGRNSYQLFFNRDELRSRAAAQGPSIKQNNGIAYLSPTDGERGGTWLLVNAFGLSIGLLNNYLSTASAGGHDADASSYYSRGMLPLACADCASVAEAIARAGNLPLDRYPPFHLVIAGTSQASVLSWDSRAYHVSALPTSGGMLTASAFQSADVAVQRQQLFSSLVGNMAAASTAQLSDFHWHQGSDGATGIRMSRADACTHSISTINVCLDKQMARFDYSPQPDISYTGSTESQYLQLKNRLTQTNGTIKRF